MKFQPKLLTIGALAVVGLIGAASVALGDVGPGQPDATPVSVASPTDSPSVSPSPSDAPVAPDPSSSPAATAQPVSTRATSTPATDPIPSPVATPVSVQSGSPATNDNTSVVTIMGNVRIHCTYPDGQYSVTIPVDVPQDNQVCPATRPR